MAKYCFMKTKILLLLLLLLNLSYLTEAQAVRTADSLLILSKRYQQALKNLSLLRLPERYKGDKAPELPPVLDNSTLAFFRPIFEQNGPTCGQASSIGYAFTYEINRLRGISSNSISTRYPPHFSYNLISGEGITYGASYFHSFDVLKSIGTPNTQTFGGFYGPYGMNEEYLGNYWMDGYDKYYQAMKNRLDGVYSIDVSTIEGIRTLKYWLLDHLDGSRYGGVANFYTQGLGYRTVLPEGTPEAGKDIVIHWWNSVPYHALTIVGYNDSIRFDYNGDGLYTNDIDINGDNKVDLRDWEIGGFKFADSWNINNSERGFYYMTYASCADSILYDGEYRGGIWNSIVNIQYVKEYAEPKLTAKITIKHTQRGKLRVRMGFSTNLSSTYPDFVMMFPIMNYLGGNHYMQGGKYEYDKTIEFGLDITPLMDMIPSGAEARFFLLVDEDDPEDEGEGEIVGFSLMDYTGGVKEISCSQSNIPIENGTTSLWIDHSVEYDDVQITTDVLKGAMVDQEYYYRIEADGGTAPYSFTIDKDYVENNGSQEFELFDEHSYDSDSVVQELDFDFPFYGENYHQVNLSKDGYLFFDRYVIDEYSHFYQLFQENKVISPFLLSSENNTIINEGMWYQGNSDSASFRWKSHISDEPSSVLNFSLTLYKNGEIGFSYGDNSFETTQWIAGLSAGKNKLYQFAKISTYPDIPPNYHCLFTPGLELDSLQLSHDGILSGIFKEEYLDKSLKIKVSDASNLTATKIIPFSSEPFSLLQLTRFSTRNPYDTSLLQYGDTVAISIKVENKGMLAQTNAKLKIRSSSPYIELQNNEIQLGVIDIGESKEIDSAFTFVIAKTIPVSVRFDMNTILESDEGGVWEKQFFFRANSPELTATYRGTTDNNDSILNPGETADVLFDISNIGIVPIRDVSIVAHSVRNEVIFNTSEAIMDSLGVGETRQVLFNLSAGENIIPGSIFPVNITMQDKKGYKKIGNVIMAVGNLVEDFETGDLSRYHWNASFESIHDTWKIIPNNYEGGKYSVQSIKTGLCTLSLRENFLCSGNIRFSYFKSSPEAYLLVEENGGSLQTYNGSGEWLTGSYPVSKGLHEILWHSISGDSSKNVILDNISFPLVGITNPILKFSPDRMQDTLFQSNYYENTLNIRNMGRGNIYFSGLIVDSLDNIVDWVKVSPEYGKIGTGESFTCKISLYAQELNPGNSEAILRIFDHTGRSHDIPLRFTLRELKRNACNDFEIASFPNPFRDKIRIDFMVKIEQNIEIQIFDLQGNIIKSAYLGRKKAGANYFYWNGENNEGTQVPSGVYFLEISSEKYNCTQKIVKIQ